MSNILAEVEGIFTKSKCIVCNGTKDRRIFDDCLPVPCKICDKDGMVTNTLPDYPNDLEACMRVARKMGVWVIFDTYKTKPSIHVDWVENEGNPMMQLDNPSNPAATLYPMLVEIAEERKG